MERYDPKIPEGVCFTKLKDLQFCFSVRQLHQEHKLFQYMNVALQNNL